MSPRTITTSAPAAFAASKARWRLSPLVTRCKTGCEGISRADYVFYRNLDRLHTRLLPPCPGHCSFLEDERAKYHDFDGLNVIVTPHIGWYTKEAISRMLDITLGNIKAFMEGTPRNRVN